MKLAEALPSDKMKRLLLSVGRARLSEKIIETPLTLTGLIRNDRFLSKSRRVSGGVSYE